MGSFTGRALFGYFFYSLEKVSEPKEKIYDFQKGFHQKIDKF
jgi:hypothetical protein